MVIYLFIMVCSSDESLSRHLLTLMTILKRIRLKPCAKFLVDHCILKSWKKRTQLEG